ncbi:hypothetical protein JCM8547_000249 [Rhodosporidiobolus lusitaniae]
MKSAIPVLPPELLDIILRDAFPPSASTPNQLNRVRLAHEERDLASWASSAGKSWLPFVRSLLFTAPFVNTRTRADKFSRALRLALPGHPETKGYLAKLVHRLTIEPRERELPRNEDLVGQYSGADGVTPLQVAELASFLPELEALDLAAGDKPGWVGDPAFLRTLQKFKNVKHLEVSSGGLGWSNPLVVCSKMEKLETLKTLTTLVLWDCILSLPEFTSLFESLSPSSHHPTTAQPLGGPSSLPTPSLRRLTLHRLRSRSPSLPDTPPTDIPFPPHLLISHLSPLMPTLTTLHLTLYERPILANNAQRTFLATSGQLRDGHLDLPETGERPGNALAALFGEEVKAVTLGGPFCVSSPGLYDALDRSAQGGGRIRILTLQDCGAVGRPSDGLNAKGFVEALDREWATQLEKVDVRLMPFSMMHDEEAPCWGEKELDKLKERAEQISKERERQGSLSKRMIVECDEEEAERRREEREYYEARAKRKTTSSSGRAGGRGKGVTTQEDRAAGVSGRKRKKTKE